MTRGEAGGLRIYAALLRRPHVARFLLGGVLVQFPYAMVNMALLIGARDGYGSYSSAGLAAAVMSIAGAFFGPNVGRAIDRWGQKRVVGVIGAFWVFSIAVLGLVLVLRPPYWALVAVVVMLGISVPGGSLIRARWREALREESSVMPSALSLTSVAEEFMWVLSTPIATALATLVSPIAALVFGIFTILAGLHLLLGDSTFEPAPLGERVRARLRGAQGPRAELGSLGNEGERAEAGSGDCGIEGAFASAAHAEESMILEGGADVRAGAEARAEAVGECAPGVAPTAQPSSSSAVERLWTPTFAVLLLVLIFYGAFQTTTGIAIVAFARELDMQAWAGTVTACFSGGSMVGALVYGMRAWPGSLWARFYIGLAALAVSCSLLVLVGSMPAAAIVMLISGLFQAPTVVNINQIFMRIVPAYRFTEGMALFGSMWVIGMSASNIVAGATIDRWGAFGGFATVVGFALGALVLALVSMPAVKRALELRPEGGPS
ncbi:MAG: hypothetical protein SOX57_07060 [Schaalia hyovaginalis]|uniref:MFS transporter n=1 Tax=Schaalia hyovaginalis TaxID=29316 RepID=UPI002A7F5677|nr:MFS transporter [Schaalia hyovaginalis]MDY3664506.1 hypothetical protein [Schaalia hyovaginalis]MDY4263073.1 hypothetical protein [Schaalia hyovaginalis]MDY5600517.1 hypothetical protein [Schaalia hyovaginalis]